MMSNKKLCNLFLENVHKFSEKITFDIFFEVKLPRNRSNVNNPRPFKHLLYREDYLFLEGPNTTF